MNDPYIRQALVERIIDGDSVTILVDVGFNIYTTQTVQLAGINAPETVGRRRAAGTRAKAYLSELLPPRQAVTIVSFAPRGNEATYRVMLYKGDILINDAMVQAGHAVKTTEA